MRAGLVALLVLAGCAGIEGDIKRAEIREFMANFVRGRDRGAGYYAKKIKDSSSKPRGGRYQHVAPAHISHFIIDRSVRGLGGTKIRSSDDLALAADWLLFTLAYDPTPSIRSLACEQLGRLLVRLPLTAAPPTPKDARTDQRINNIAQDLFGYGEEIRKGNAVAASRVEDRMRTLAEEAPPTRQAAMQMVRAFAIPPVYGTTNATVRAASEELVPDLVRDCILVALREVACGDALRPQFPEDESALVRAAAAGVLARAQSPLAVAAAARRLADPLYPAESDPDVRSALLGYLAEVGGPRAFAIGLARLEDVDPGVRFHAQKALLRMTGARVPPRTDAWKAWLARHPAWQLPPAKSAGE